MLNKIISLVMMIIFIPIFFIIGLIIVIDDGFPIFFLQKRIGKNKKLFHIIKFRTMNNNTKDIATHLVKNYDNKILRSGNFLRKYSLDELPQIINVIKVEGSGLVTITKVKTSHNLRFSKIYISFIGNTIDNAELLDSMNQNISEYRYHMGKTLKLKYIPEIKFYYDNLTLNDSY